MRSLPIMSLVALAATSVMSAQEQTSEGPWQTYGTENGEWRSYAGDIAGTKYSPLDQIDAGNFSDLEIAWEWTSIDNFVSRTTPGGGEWSAPLRGHRRLAGRGGPRTSTAAASRLIRRACR